MAYRDGGDLNALGASIAERRRACGMSQEELAHACLVSRPTISSWERGRTQPSAQDVKLLAAVFDITADELLSACEPVARAVSADRREMKLLLLFDGIVFAISVVAIFDNIGSEDYAGSPSFFIMLACVVLLIASSWRQRKIAARHGFDSMMERSRFAAGVLDPADLSKLPEWVRWINEHDWVLWAIVICIQYAVLLIATSFGAPFELQIALSVIAMSCYSAIMLLSWRISS